MRLLLPAVLAAVAASTAGSAPTQTNFDRSQRMVGMALDLCWEELNSVTIEGPMSAPVGSYRRTQEPEPVQYLDCVNTYLTATVADILAGGDGTDRTGSEKPPR